jgi:hypothetical protein
MQKLAILLILVGNFVYAQIQQPLRVEYEYENEHSHNVLAIPGSDQAVMTFMESDRENDSFIWTARILDKNLKVVKEQKFTFDDKYKTYYSYTTSDKIYLLMQEYKKGEFELTEINLANLSEKRQTGVLVKKLYIKEIIALNGNVFVAGSIKDLKHIFVLNPAANSVKRILPGALSKDDLGYEDVQLVENTNQKEVVFKYKYCQKKICEYRLLRFNDKGEQLGDFYTIPSPEGEKEINDITISKLATDSYLLTGTYRAEKKGASNGIYFAKITNQKFDYFKTYNFLDLNNFTNYLSDRSKEKIERKKERKEGKGDELNINYNVATHDIVEYQGEYLFIGEFYYATYRQESYTTFVNGKSVTQYRTVFDGYQYTHSAIAGFDKQGNLKWSNSFEMYLTYKPYSVKKFIRYSIDKDKVELLFATGSQIKSITFKGNEIVKDKSIDVVKTSDENDDIKATYSSNLFWWYGQNYLSFGYQKIKNDEKERGDRKRHVFYINKISY